MNNVLGRFAVLTSLIVNLGTPAFAQTTGEIAKGNCKAAADACQQAVDYCGQKKGKLNQASTMNALNDCIDACKATERFLSRSSNLSGKSAQVATEACNEAAKACDQYKGDNQMTNCANEVRKACSNLSKVK